MAANLYSKLVLQDAEFAKKLEKNKKQVSAFGKGGAQAFGTVASVVGKFAAGVGVAMGGVEAFNKVMNSSQTLADSWGGVVEAAKTTVDSFFYSISNGDWTPFEGGLMAVIERAREAYAAMDDLANVKMSFNYGSSKDRADFAKALNVARDEKSSVVDREAALKTAEQLAATMRKNAAEYERSAKQAFMKKLGDEVGVTDTSIFTKEMIEKALRLDENSTRAAMRDEVTRLKKQYDAAYKAAAVTTTKFGGKEVTTQEFLGLNTSQKQEKIAAKRAVLKEQYAETLLLYAALEKFSDEELGAMGAEISAAERAIESAESSANSLRRVAKQIKNANDKLGGAVKIAESEVAAVPAEADTTAVGIDYAADRKYRQDKEKAEKARLAEMGIPETLGEIPVYTIPEEAKKSVQEYADEVSKLGGAFGQLGSAIDGTEGAMIEWLGQAVSAAAQVAETISLLSAESAAHTANANAAATDAAAKAMAANAGIPIAGVAMGTVAVASIISVLKSIPKLATGAIATGPTVALVGEAGPEAIIPLSKLDKMVGGAAAAREVRVVGTMKARGKDLVGTIANYNSAQNVYG